ncbi:hypothetical protein H310_00386 [Aphanomyces invadans]|uniref:oligopeptidase A n=1 Tax=Aphanomyces invadans TaxID=157072 RepID=A0A024UVK3_9STRA|nr:hypothetical protein H310_00386 [Aphanomyces invadans]ETW09970.1 hypothetical protein H310_00386 [Aphanomyces invadans]|eukprot:XP_008861381.1 hypothetical protein H310_00386 [Aphanomyces invadans]
MTSTSNNPLLADWSVRPFSFPPFEEIKACHFQPAFEYTKAKHLEELKQIANNPEEPTFDNTIKTFDRAGALFKRVEGVYYNLTASYCPPDLQAVESELAGPLAEHSSKVTTFPGLFERIQHVYNDRNSAGYTPVQVRLVERFYLDFVREGALFDKETQDKYNAIVKELAELTTHFRQQVTTDESEVTVPVTLAELEGVPTDIVAAARQAAADRNLDGHVITLGRSLVEPFLTFCPNRDARERVWKAWTSRGELSPDRDNLSVAVKILKLRSQQAKLHGYKNFADYQTVDTMAQTPEKVLELLNRVWTPAKVAANKEREVLSAYAVSKGESAEVRASDWRFYSEKVRAAKYDLDDAIVKPYFSLERMVEAVFDVANRLYGLTFELRQDLKTYHPDVQVYQVKGPSGDIVALFLHDNFARPHKNSGAWMSEFRSQSRNIDDINTSEIPIVINNNNFTKGNPTLLSFDDCVTLFHEFGHGLHGMLSDVTYQRLASTNVLKDFVELPSQLMEHWVRQPEVLAVHARHYKTNEPIPAELLAKVMAALKFQQGFATVEYTASALVDQALHAIEDVDGLDLTEFEKATLKKLEMPPGIVMRHRIPHFSHLFASSSYASGYYVYLWAEVLDADAFQAFVETGNIFDKGTADRAKKFIYSAGNTRDLMEGYRLFRGRDPNIEAMLIKKGLI